MPGFDQPRDPLLVGGLKVLGAGLLVSVLSCATEPAPLTATYSLASVDSRPVPTDLEDGFSDGPGFSRAVNRRLDFRRPDSVAYAGRIEKLTRQSDGSVQVEFGFDFCLTAGYTREGSSIVLKYGFPPGGTRDPWFFVSSDTLYVEGTGIKQIERQIVGASSFGTHLYRYLPDAPGSPAVSCP